MNTKKILCAVAIGASCYLSAPVHAQTSVATADKYYEMGLYDKAADEYAAMIKDDRSIGYEAYDKLAKCHIYTNDPSKAIAVYEQAALQYDLPTEAYLDWASALKKIGHHEEATDLMSFASIKKGVRYDEIKLSEVQTYMVRNLLINTKGDEFAPAYKGDQLVFVSDVDGLQQARPVSHEAEVVRYELYTASSDDGKRKPLRMLLDNTAQEGAVTYAPDGKWIAYTQVNIPIDQSPKVGNGKSGTLYLAELDEQGNWGRRIALPCNDVGVANVFPHFANDGQMLYFASNRPGGYGGYDIYRIKRLGDGWSQPENLGPKVNGTQDEISPYTDQGALYFASNRVNGTGGFDLYGYDLDGSTTVYNMGAELNSSYDDYAMITKDGGKSGYFTTNRPGGQGGEDILAFHRINTAPSDLAASAANLNKQPTSSVDALTTNQIKRDDQLPAMAPSASAEPTNLVTSGLDVPVFRVADANTDPERILAVFTIQVAAYREQNNNYQSIAKRLKDIGFVYRVYYHDMVKVRVGQYEDETAARSTLLRVKDRGYKDAFIVKEELVKEEPAKSSSTITTHTTAVATPNATPSTADQSTSTPSTTTTPTSDHMSSASTATVAVPSQMDNQGGVKPDPTSVSDVVSKPKESTPEVSKPLDVKEAVAKAPISDERIEKIKSQVTRYRLKLGSYTDMTQFDGKRVKQYGSLFNEERGEFTMVFLGDYMTIEDAQAIAKQVQHDGFDKVIIYGVAGDTLVKVQ